MTRGVPLAPIAVSLVLLAVAVVLGTEYVAVPWLVAGSSMEPTLRAGDRVLVDRWTLRHRAARAGDVVLLEGPGGVSIVKRISERPGGPADSEQVWVVGDNAAVSVDSRQFGALPADRLRGRVVWCYWPPSHAGPVRGSSVRNGRASSAPPRR